MISTYDRAPTELSKSTVCDIEKAVNPRNIYPLIYGMSFCCQEKANGNAKGSELKQELGQNWARTGESVYDRAVRLMYSAFVANFVTVFR